MRFSDRKEARKDLPPPPPWPRLFGGSIEFNQAEPFS